MEQFTCRACGLPKDRTDFRWQREGKTRVLDCRDCEREKAKTSRRSRYGTPEGRSAILESNKRYLQKPEVVERLSLLGKQRYAEDEDFRETVKDNARNWRAANPERKQELSRNWYQENKKDIQRKLQLKQENNPWLRLRGNIRSRVCEALNAADSSKAGASFFHNVPYTLTELKEHLEHHPDWDQSWMSWSNYGSGSQGRSWQLDHIIPQSMFPYGSMHDDDFRLCWSLLNLRPLESVRNQSEGDRLGLFPGFRRFSDIREAVLSKLQSHACDETPSYIIDKFQPIRLGESCPGSTIGLKYLDSIFTNRFRASTQGHSSLMASLDDPDLLLRVVAHIVRSGDVVTSASVLKNLKFVVRAPGHFFPASAHAIWAKYSVPGLPVFDPCLGWGGRSLGAMTANLTRLVGCDVQADVVANCRAVADGFSSVSTTTSEFHHVDSLQFLRGSSEMFGMIFTSPPYMDTEDYGVESDAMRQDWLDDFVLPLAREFRRHLVPEGKVALHLKDLKGAPTFTAYHSAMMAAGFKQVARHKYGRTWTQAVYVYGL